ncbi:SixA phosphatase family protein [Schlesneria paludicola]|uniref:SixA phosphatase family protein n=1 Tax=Schlesneria paludicola TaxID=360056 RepID=UPI00029B402B|nr:histidine phosphatase family protein [Schlesneria paludicola]
MSTKTLLLLRHAKSNWDDPNLDDHDRPLNERGRKAAKRMGRLIHHEQLPVDLLICSTAIRAQETAERVLKQVTNKPTRIDRADLYLAPPAQIAAILAAIDDQFQCPLLIGHNPGFEEFLAALTQTELHFPTAALAQIEFELNLWHEFSLQTVGQIKKLWRPRDLD